MLKSFWRKRNQFVEPTACLPHEYTHTPTHSYISDWNETERPSARRNGLVKKKIWKKRNFIDQMLVEFELDFEFD